MKILIKSSGMGWVGVKKVRKSCDVIYACSYDKSVILHLKVAKFQEMPFLLPYDLVMSPSRAGSSQSSS